MHPARWLDLRSPDSDHPGYAGHKARSEALAAGYVAALAAHDAEDRKAPLSVQDAQRLRNTTIVVPAGQLSERVLEDLRDEILPLRS